MQHDELIWQNIGHSHCSFRAQVGKEKAFCRNEFNVSGLCNRSCCPLANSRYATIREHDGKCFLYMKTIERAHSPKNLWERVPLHKNYLQALQQLDEQLQFWPEYLIHKNKQRLTKITQYLIRMRKLAKAMTKPQLVRYNKKEERLLARKEAKALVAADLERTIGQQLLTRLKQGTYGDIYNFPSASYAKALDATEGEYESEAEREVAGGGARKRSKPSEEEEEEEDEEMEDDDDGPTLREFLEAGSEDEDAGEEEDDEEEEEEEEEDALQSELVDDDSAPDLDDEEQGEYDAVKDGRALPTVNDEEGSEEEEDSDEEGQDGSGSDDDDAGGSGSGSRGGKAGSGVVSGAGKVGAGKAGSASKVPPAKGRVRFSTEEEEEGGSRQVSAAAAARGGGGSRGPSGKPDFASLARRGPGGRVGGKATLEIEYEDEDEEERPQRVAATNPSRQAGSKSGRR